MDVWIYEPFTFATNLAGIADIHSHKRKIECARAVQTYIGKNGMMKIITNNANNNCTYLIWMNDAGKMLRFSSKWVCAPFSA